MSETLVRQLPVDDLIKPDHDVREGRDQQGLDSLAESIERSGLIHPIMVHPLPPEDVESVDDWRRQEWDDLLEEASGFKVVDGWSRTLALRQLNKTTARCEIHREPPENQTVVSLEANTTRLEMSDYETVSALKEHYEATSKTQAEVAEEAGISRSRLTTLFSCLDGFEPAVEAWASPDTHVTAKHVRIIESLDSERAKEMTFRDCMNYERSASMTKEVAQNAKKQAAQAEESAGDGNRSADKNGAMQDHAEASDGAPVQTETPVCLITGEEAVTKKAVPVSEEAAGLIDQCRSTNTPLLNALEEEE